MAIRAITFDFWQTLFRDVDGDQRYRLRLDALVKATRAPRPKAERALQDMHREFFRVHIEEQRNLTPHDGVRLVCEALGVRLAPAPFENLADVFATAVLEFPPEPIEGALDAVRAAAARFPVGLISDVGMSPGWCLTQLLEAHGFRPHFTALTYSHDLGVSKPQAPMFQTTAEALGVRPDELLHIGDLEPTDIAGARGVGARAALFTGVHDKYRAGTAADHILDDWTGFAGALPALAGG